MRLLYIAIGAVFSVVGFWIMLDVNKPPPTIIAIEVASLIVGGTLLNRGLLRRPPVSKLSLRKAISGAQSLRYLGLIGIALFGLAIVFLFFGSDKQYGYLNHHRIASNVALFIIVSAAAYTLWRYLKSIKDRLR